MSLYSVPSADNLGELLGQQSSPIRKFVFGTVLFLLVAALVLSFLQSQKLLGLDAPLARSIASRSPITSMRAMSDNSVRYTKWIQNHGFGFEYRLFHGFADLMVWSAVKLAPTRDRDGLGATLLVAVHGSIVRIGFLVFASWRFILAVLIGVGLYRVYSYKPYDARDILGETGNGRIFFSGAKASLRNVDERGLPMQQVTGLACPARVANQIMKSRPLGKILALYSAESQTGLSLAGVIERSSTMPAFVPPQFEREKLARSIVETDLGTMAMLALEEALCLHSAILKGEQISVPELKHMQGTLQPEMYADQLQVALTRTLTESTIAALRECRPEMVAVLVLSIYAGRVLTHVKTGTGWFRQSSYPNLSCRAVLHSLSSFSDEFTVSERTTIRRAIVFALRHGPFGPVRLPSDISMAEYGLRQWAEILLVLPYQLASTINEVELNGIVRELLNRWIRRIQSEPGCFLSHLVTTETIAVAPVTQLVSSFELLIRPEERARLEKLCSLVSSEQAEQAKLIVDEGHSTGIQSFERVFLPLRNETIQELALSHATPATLIDAWSALRVVLNSFGLLSRRVGDYSVPEHSIIRALLHTDEGAIEGKIGSVALRASALDYQLGVTWRLHARKVMRVSMAESSAEFASTIERSQLEEEYGSAG